MGCRQRNTRAGGGDEPGQQQRPVIEGRLGAWPRAKSFTRKRDRCGGVTGTRTRHSPLVQVTFSASHHSRRRLDISARLWQAWAGTGFGRWHVTRRDAVNGCW